MAATLSREGPQWVWKDGKDGYEAFLKRLGTFEKEEVLAAGTLHGINVFSTLLATEVGSGLKDLNGISLEEEAKASWRDAYLRSEIFSDVYLLHTGANSSLPLSPGTFQKAMNYRVDPDTGLLHIFRHGFHLPCIPEAKIPSVLRLVHDQAGHLGKQDTLAKLRGFAYWPSQSTDVENYIRGCLQCARHGSATKNQLLHPVRVYRPFQLLGMDFIGPLPISRKSYRFILHIIDYFSLALDRVFTLYATPEGTYCDQGQHFNNQEFREFFSQRGVTLAFSPSGASQSTGMVEIGNGY